MGRYRNEFDEERDYYPREDRLRREQFGAYNEEPIRARRQFDNERRPDYNRGGFGERAEYANDEPRYANYGGERFREENRRSSLDDMRGDLSSGRGRDRDQY